MVWAINFCLILITVSETIQMMMTIHKLCVRCVLRCDQFDYYVLAFFQFVWINRLSLFLVRTHTLNTLTDKAAPQFICNRSSHQICGSNQNIKKTFVIQSKWPQKSNRKTPQPIFYQRKQIIQVNRNPIGLRDDIDSVNDYLLDLYLLSCAHNLSINHLKSQNNGPANEIDWFYRCIADFRRSIWSTQ